MGWSRGVLVAAACVLAACGEGGSHPQSGEQQTADLPAGDDAAIQRHIDGDTIGVEAGSSIRLIGIDTPETVHPSQAVQCFGREASAFMAELLPVGTEVRLVYDVERFDRYDRTLAYIYRLSDGLFVNSELLRAGYAQVATYPPNVAHVGEFLELQRVARVERRGLWASCDGETDGVGGRGHRGQG